MGSPGLQGRPYGLSGNRRAEHGYSRSGFGQGESCMGVARGPGTEPFGAKVSPEPRLPRLKQPSGPQGQLPERTVTSCIQRSGRGRYRGGFLACLMTPHASCGLCLGWRQEDNHSYYVSRLYGPSEPRSRELWVDVAEANRSQVKVHRILSNTHRQASVSAPVPGSAALGWEAGVNPRPLPCPPPWSGCG